MHARESNIRSSLLLAAILLAVLSAQVYYLHIFTRGSYFIGTIDDAFYYYQIGRNIADGRGPTFDGEHPTNGYHPLWMGFAVATFYLLPEHEIAPILILLSVACLSLVGTLILLWRFLRQRASSPGLASAIFLFFALNLWIQQAPFDGLETGLVLLLFTIFLLLFLKTLEEPHRFRNYTVLGITAGLMVLGRVDFAIFAGAAFLWLLLKISKGEGSTETFGPHSCFSGTGVRKVLYLGIPFAILVMPWFIYNFWTFGTLFPSSGLSFTRINHDWFFSKPRTLVAVILWSCFNFAKALIGMLAVSGVPVPMIDRPFPTLIESALLGVVIATVFYFLLRASSREALRNLFLRNALGQILSVMTAAAIAFAFLQGGIRWSGNTRYYLEMPILMVFLLLLVFEHLRPFSALSRRARLLFVTIGLGFLIVSTSMYHLEWIKVFFSPPPEPSVIAASRWMNLNLPEDARIASFHSGTVGYYTKRFLMNSDGKVNNAGYEALKKKKIWEFLKENRIQYIAEADKTLTDGRIIWLGINNPLDHLQILQEFPNEARTGAVYTIYKVISY